jgi:hypothetical protein
MKEWNGTILGPPHVSFGLISPFSDEAVWLCKVCTLGSVVRESRWRTGLGMISNAPAVRRRNDAGRDGSEPLGTPITAWEKLQIHDGEDEFKELALAVVMEYSHEWERRNRMAVTICRPSGHSSQTIIQRSPNGILSRLSTFTSVRC